MSPRVKGFPAFLERGDSCVIIAAHPIGLLVVVFLLLAKKHFATVLWRVASYVIIAVCHSGLILVVFCVFGSICRYFACGRICVRVLTTISVTLHAADAIR